MENINSNPILNFNDNQLQNVRKAVGYEDINKLKQDIEHLQNWIRKQNHFRQREFDPEYLERLLIYSKGSIERTKQKLDKLSTCVNLMPDYLQNFDIKNEFRSLHNVGYFCVLPKPTKDNYRVMVTSFNGNDDSKLRVLDYSRYHIVLSQYLLHNDYCHGAELIADTRYLTMGTIKKINPIILNKGILVITDILSQRMKKLHLISGSSFFNTVLPIIKQALSEKLKQRLIIHSDIESLCEYIPKEQLPKDYGGDEKSLKELSGMQFLELSSDEHIARMKFMEESSTDESARLSCEFNEEYSGMPGSFKSLCID